MAIVIDYILGEPLMHEHIPTHFEREPDLTDLKDGEVVTADVAGSHRVYWREGGSVYYVTGTEVVYTYYDLLMETGDYLLLETGDKIVLE